jgi:hypothetical protein
MIEPLILGDLNDVSIPCDLVQFDDDAHMAFMNIFNQI